MRRRSVGGILVPGAEGWEYWVLSAKEPPRLAPPQEMIQKGGFVAALPTRNFLACAFWLPPQADLWQLGELEFSVRHLGRRGQIVEVVEVERQADRVLVLGVATADDPELPPFVQPAARIETPARLWDSVKAPCLVWREFGEICAAFRRKEQTVYFMALGERHLSPELAAHLSRCAQKLEAEEVIESLPEVVLAIGAFEHDELLNLHQAMGAEIRQAEEGIVPSLPQSPADFPPPAIREFRAAQERSRRFFAWAAVGIAIYLGVLAGFLGALWLGGQRAQQARAEALALEPAAAAAREAVQRWTVLRPALDSRSFALDLLAAVAAALPSESVRFTRCALGVGKIELAGEAQQVAQTYELLERLKSSQALEEFEWEASPPEIAGRDIVRFNIQGRRHDARTDSE